MGNAATIKWEHYRRGGGGDGWRASHAGWSLEVAGTMADDSSWEWEVSSPEGSALSETITGIVFVDTDDEEAWETAAAQAAGVARSRAEAAVRALCRAKRAGPVWLKMGEPEAPMDMSKEAIYDRAAQALDGRLGYGSEAVVQACEAYRCAEDHLPDLFDEEGYSLDGTVAVLVKAYENNGANQELLDELVPPVDGQPRPTEAEQRERLRAEVLALRDRSHLCPGCSRPTTACGDPNGPECQKVDEALLLELAEHVADQAPDLGVMGRLEVELARERRERAEAERSGDTRAVQHHDDVVGVLERCLG